MELAVAHPDRVLSLALFSTGSRIGTPEGWHERAAQVRASGTASIVTVSAARWFAPDLLARVPGLGATALHRLVEVDDESYALCCGALAGYDLDAAVGALSLPVVCATGEFDQPTAPEQVQALAEAIPGASYQLIARAAHLPVVEQPEETAAIIRAQLASLLPVDRYEAGMAVRRAVLGDVHVNAATAAITPETADFQDFITRYAWGEIWTRPGLSRRDRSLLTLSSLISAGHEREIAMHVRAVLTNGLSRTEISEAILHTAI